MSFTRHIGKRRSTRDREYQVSSEGRGSLNYDSTKNSILYIENGLQVLRQKLKSVKKGANKSRPYSLKEIQDHVQTKIHPHVGELNSYVSTPFKEVLDLQDNIRELHSDLTRIRKEKGDLKQRLSESEKELTSFKRKKEDEENRMRSEITGLYQQVEGLTHTNKGLQAEKEKLAAQLHNDDENITGMKMEIKRLEQELQNRRSVIDSLQSVENGYKAKSEQLEKRTEEMETTTRNLENENSVLQQKYNDEVQNRENDINMINRLQGDLHKQQENYKIYIQQKEAEMKSTMNDELQRQADMFQQHFLQKIQEKDNDLKSWQTEAERRQNTIQTLISQREEEKQGKEEERKQKDEALTRLSAIAGDRLRNNNPGITDLSDPNRPMKIAEKFTEMYDNDWTDSMEALEDLGIPEDECVEILLHFLTDSYEECGRIVEELDRYLERAVMVTASDCGTDQSGFNQPNQTLPGEITKPIKDLRRKMTDNNIEILQKMVTQHLKEKRNLSDDHVTACKKFVEDCIKYAWMMQIQDPPVYISWDFPHGSKIDNNVLRSYTKAGDHVDFIVWPVLYLHRDGPVLNKGVVQPMQSTPATEL